MTETDGSRPSMANRLPPLVFKGSVVGTKSPGRSTRCWSAGAKGINHPVSSPPPGVLPLLRMMAQEPVDRPPKALAKWHLGTPAEKLSRL